MANDAYNGDLMTSYMTASRCYLTASCYYMTASSISPIHFAGLCWQQCRDPLRPAPIASLASVTTLPTVPKQRLCQRFYPCVSTSRSAVC